MPVVLASGYGFAEPTLLDPRRTDRLVGLLQVVSGTATVARTPIEVSGRPAVELWVFRSSLMFVQATAGAPRECAAGSFSYRRECASEVAVYYPAAGDSQRGMLVGRTTYEVDTGVLAILEEAGLPTRVEVAAPVEPPAGLEARVGTSTYERVVQASGALAVLLGIVLLSGAAVSLLPARQRRTPRGRVPGAVASVAPSD